MTPPLQLIRRRKAASAAPAEPTVDLVKRSTATKAEKPDKKQVIRRRAGDIDIMPALPLKPRLSDLRERRSRARRALAFRSLGYLGMALIVAGVSFLLVPQLRARDAGVQVPSNPDPTPIAAPVAPDPYLSPSPQPSPSTSASAPPGAAVTTAGPAMYGPWANTLSQKLDIPVVALQAYAFAQVQQNLSTPGCKLSWTLLAGLGRAESYHGRYRGAVLRPDGTSQPPIIGIQLTRIPDTDNGQLDRDTVYDRAVGPMQFIPGTWKIYASDVTSDGIADPFNINDAARGSAKLLCANGRDLSTGKDWAAAVYSYNHVNTYVANVYKYADNYARLSLGA